MLSELFDTKNFKKPLIDQLLGEWSNVLFEEINKKYMVNLSKRLVELRRTKIIYPEPDNTFKAYKLTPPDKIKVVIIGQDLYHNGNADGLTFSCKIKISSSLQKIFEGIEQQFGSCSYNMNLERWSKQGVFLLNSILTVERGLPLSHANLGWQMFTNFSLAQLKQKKLVWLLFGSEAHKLEKLAKKERLVIKCEHPASASYNKREWFHNNCFVKANEYLNESIRW